MTPPPAKQDLLLTILRGLVGRCPACGHGKLFSRYLKPVQTCAHCGEALGHIRADDGPAWLTIIIVGHILAPILLFTATDNTWPDWVSMIVWPLLALVLALIVLPRAKGVFIGVIWRSGCIGGEH
ncbi:MAG: DUF983 domain-containing protein [Alphaproteobacteria bacterium]|nr:DUF983 domain-containing protein [Alphaproteobacteria bacterium]